jgi:hypothetical protein
MMFKTYNKKKGVLIKHFQNKKFQKLKLLTSLPINWILKTYKRKVNINKMFLKKQSFKTILKLTFCYLENRRPDLQKKETLENIF